MKILGYGRHMGHGQGEGAEVFFHLAAEEEGAAVVQQGAEAAVRVREKGGFHQAGFVFEGEKFHGFIVPGAYHLAGDQQTGETDAAAHISGEIHRLDEILVLQAIAVQGHGVKVAQKPERFVFSPQALVWAVRR